MRMFKIVAALCSAAFVVGIMIAWQTIQLPSRVVALSSIPQTDQSSSGAVRAKAVEAWFSGTETLLRVEIVDEGANPPAPLPGTLSVRSSDVDLSGFAAGFVSSARRDSGGLFLELPPVLHGSTPHVTIRAIRVDARGDRRVIAGEWPLALALPAPAQLATLLKTTDIPERSFNVDGAAVRVSGIRSVSRILISYDRPRNVSELAPPRLFFGGTQLELISSGVGVDGQAVASFVPPTGGGTLRFELGPVSLSSDLPSAQSLRLQVGGVGDAEKAIRSDGNPAPVTVAGPSAEAVQKADVGVREGRHWLRLTLVGNWDPDPTDPGGATVLPWRVAGSDGRDLQPAFWGQSFSKDQAGEVGYGQTELAVYYDDPAIVGELVLTVGRHSLIRQGPFSTELATRVP